MRKDKRDLIILWEADGETKNLGANIIHSLGFGGCGPRERVS